MMRIRLVIKDHTDFLLLYFSIGIQNTRAAAGHNSRPRPRGNAAGPHGQPAAIN